MFIANALHLLSAVIWVGGMFFAYMALRPVAGEQLEPPARLRLWQGVFARFFTWVSIAVVLLLSTGLWMVIAGFGGFGNVRPYVHIMFLLGLIMMAIYGHLFFVPYKRLRIAVSQEDWPQGGQQLAVIRKLVLINLCLGLLVVIVAGAGRYF